LKLPESWRIHNIFHAALLRPYIENEVYGNNYPRPLPELLEVYEVETNNPQTSEKRKRISILREMERLPRHRSNMGTCVCLLHRWRHVKRISRSTSTIGADWSIKNKRIEEEK
jgi:hypothetical protein